MPAITLIVLAVVTTAACLAWLGGAMGRVAAALLLAVLAFSAAALLFGASDASPAWPRGCEAVSAFAAASGFAAAFAALRPRRNVAAYVALCVNGLAVVWLLVVVAVVGPRGPLP